MGTGDAGAVVLPLDAVDATLGRVGGKGAALALLARAGIPVPPGFHITTRAYDRFASSNNLHPASVAALDGVAKDDRAPLERAATRIRELFEHGAIPDDVEQAIRDAYVGMGGIAVAVRSAATAEDLPGMSSAGQQESYLNIAGEGAMLAAVARCWGSLWTARAIGYRARYRVTHDEVALAVVIQALVPADASGVLFTANPVTGARDEIVVNAAWGLGEAIVGGLVTPDSITIAKRSGAIVARSIADKAVQTIRTPDGTRTAPLVDERRRAPVLDFETIAELTRLGVRIEDLFGYPVDVEWALHENRLFVVQARPITALRDPAQSPHAERARPQEA